MRMVQLAAGLGPRTELNEAAQRLDGLPWDA